MKKIVVESKGQDGARVLDINTFDGLTTSDGDLRIYLNGKLVFSNCGVPMDSKCKLNVCEVGEGCRK